MEREQQKIKAILYRDIRLRSRFTYQNFAKRGSRIIPKLSVYFEHMDNFFSRREKMMKVFRVFKRIKMLKKLDFVKLAIPDSKAICLAKRMISVSCLKVKEKRLAKLWSKYLKHLKRLNCSVQSRYEQRLYYGYGRSFQQQNRQLAKKTTFLNDYLKYIPRFEMKTIEINFPNNRSPRMDSSLDYLWRFERYPESIRRICFYDTEFLQKPNGISMAHLKNLKDLKFQFGYWYPNSIEVIQSAVDLLPQVTQLEALHIDFIANYVINTSLCEALKSLTKLKKARFTFSLENQTDNLKILKCLEYWPLEDLGLRISIRGNENNLSGISHFLSKKKDLKALKLRIINKWAFENLKPIEDLLRVAEDLPQLTCFSFLTMVDTEGRRGYGYSRAGLSEINLSFRKLFSRWTPLKKFRISLHQHSFSQNALIKLLRSLKKFSPTLEKLRIDVGGFQPKCSTETEILDFIKGLHNIRSLKLYSMDTSQKMFLGLSEAIRGLKFLRTFCLGGVSSHVTKAFIDGLERILVKPGLEKFESGFSDGFGNIKSSHTLDPEDLKRKNPDLKSWPDWRYIFRSSVKVFRIHFDDM